MPEITNIPHTLIRLKTTNNDNKVSECYNNYLSEKKRISLVSTCQDTCELSGIYGGYCHPSFWALDSQIVCCVLNKWHFHFYVSAHRDFGFFSCVGYLHPKYYIKGVKNPFLNFVGYMMYQVLSESLLNGFHIFLLFHSKG